MSLESLLQSVKDAIFADKSNPYQQGDSHGLIGQIQDLFGQHQAQQGSRENPLPASQDPLGDPADLEPQSYGGGRNDLSRQYPGLRPASEDPLGDPADNEVGSANLRQQFPGLRPASEDPLGDPADQENRR